MSLLTDTNAIYSSQNASNMLFAKTLAKRINKDVYSSDKFADEKIGNLKKVVIFTHKRAFLGYLINILQPSYTLDDNLVIEYDDNVIYDNSKNDIDIYRLIFNNGNLDYIEKIIY